MKNKFLIYLLIFGITLAIPLSFTLASQDPTIAEPLASKRSNGVEVSLISFELKDDRTMVTSCIDLPDNQDWIVYTSLSDGKITVSADSMAVIKAKDPETFESSHRCYEFEFPLSLDQTSNAISFSVDKLATTLPEALDQDMCDRALAEIQSTRPEISFACIIDPQGIAFENRSEQGVISDKDLFQLINASLTETVNGPWSLPLEK